MSLKVSKNNLSVQRRKKSENISDYEKNLLQSFVLELYYESKIQANGLIRKKTVRFEFEKFLEIENRGKYIKTQNIGSLLQSINLIQHSPRDSGFFFINMDLLRRINTKPNDEIDRKHRCKTALDDLIQQVPHNTNPVDARKENIEVDSESAVYPLSFQGGCQQKVVSDFTITKLGCYICHENCCDQSGFDHHVDFHRSQSDCKFLSTTPGNGATFNYFDLSYQLCKKSRYFYFTIKTNEKDIFIERIIIIQTRLMHYINNDKVPYEVAKDGVDSFVVNSNMFAKANQHPVVIIFRKGNDRAMRFVEQHQFLVSRPCDKYCKNNEKSNPTTLVSFITNNVNLPKTERLPNHILLGTDIELDEYMPRKYINCAFNRSVSTQDLCKISPVLHQYLREDRKINRGNMSQVLSALLEIEDWVVLKDYCALSQRGIKVRTFKKDEYTVMFSKLPPNVSLENTVSCLDDIVLCLTGPERSYHDYVNNVINGFHAKVHRVHKNGICFKCNSACTGEDNCFYAKIHKKENCLKCDGGEIIFQTTVDAFVYPSREQIRYQYRALEMLALDSNMREYLLPECCNRNKNLPTVDLELFNPDIATNSEQLQAVKNIATGTRTFAPFVIFGPPGTGKTSTLVEAVLQLWKRRPNTNILITSATNAACDEVALRLCKVLKKLEPRKLNVVRLYAKSRENHVDSIDNILIECSNLYTTHFLPALELLYKYRIVVCTFTIVGKLVSAKISDTFFTHIFIDECGAATVPEVVVSLMGTTVSDTCVILAGDHKQLGPVLKSNKASELGLSMSLLEILMNRECYAVDDNGEYDYSIQSRLLRNYRSHPKIVSLYNALYYDNKLLAMAKEDVSSWALNWHLLPNKKCPIIFHPVFGRCIRTSKSFSVFNTLEIETVMMYVKELLYKGINGRKVEETDIGIVTPYKKQYKMIQEELMKLSWHQIEVGAVETFQGREKPIIIASTVRSSGFLGFVDSPKRINVILSRAKCLFILIGNPKTLEQSKDFKKIIDQCRKEKCVVEKQSPANIGSLESLIDGLSLSVT